MQVAAIPLRRHLCHLGADWGNCSTAAGVLILSDGFFSYDAIKATETFFSEAPTDVARQVEMAAFALRGKEN